MPLMSRKADYALLILSYLHRRPERGCAREIAAGFGLSRSFVANILKELCHKGFVTGRRGVRGGYVLQRPAAEMNLAELLEALDDPFHLAECNKVGGEVCCVAPICPVRGHIAEVHARIHGVLRTVTLAELFRPHEAECGGRRVGLEMVEITV
jgi:Rrf2 family protein